MHAPAPITWHFPLPRTHTGVPLGDGTTGLLVWGDEHLHLTIARSFFWDHRGANPVLEKTTYSEVRRLLEANDETGIKQLFQGLPQHPQQLGGGRLTLRFAGGARPLKGKLDLKTGLLKVSLSDGNHCTLRLARGQEWISFTSKAEYTVELQAVWDLSRESLANLGIQAPARWSKENGGGFLQTLPEDPPLAVAWRKRGASVFLATALGNDADKQVRKRLAGIRPSDSAKADAAWWQAYWSDIPALSIPDHELQQAYDLGCYKQAGLTPPEAPTATLQGPWMEDYQIPPWSNDFHLNINLQLIYGPAYATNRLSHFKPLWELMRAWMPRLRARGEHFFGRPGAMTLPHAIDDRCEVIGAFWSGTIDHACAAWIAQMAWLHYRYSMDEALLRDLAWPLLNGAFEGYWAMLETIQENGTSRLSLPVSVSPEFSTGTMRGTWGRDASFQLAALHMVARLLDEAATRLGLPSDPRWARVRAELPAYSTVPVDPSRPIDGPRRIALWQGQDLPFSHRHHSHLASIWPFGSIDPFAPEHKRTVAESLQRWTQQGPGQWTGWCIPWAAQLCLRCDQTSAALLWLKWWQYLYTNEGHGTLHNADFPGCAAWDDGALFHPNFQKEQPYLWEIMQSDAGMAAVTTLLDLVLHQRGDTLHLLPRLPKGWRDLSFDGVLAEGAFLIGATVRDARIEEIRITSRAGAHLRLAHQLGSAWTLDGTPQTGDVLSIDTTPGQTLLLRPHP